MRAYGIKFKHSKERDISFLNRAQRMQKLFLTLTYFRYCPICGKEYSQTRPTRWGGMEYIHAGDPANVVYQQSSASYKASQQCQNNETNQNP